MAEQILRDQTNSNLFPVLAARSYFQQNSYVLDPKKESELFAEHWTRVEVARMLLDEASRFDYVLDAVLLQQKIPSLDELSSLDNQAVIDIFQKLFPILEQLLLAGDIDEFYGNKINPKILKETQENLNEINTTLIVPVQLIGTRGKRDSKARLLVSRAQQNADSSLEILHTDNVVHRVVEKITQLDTGIVVNPNLAHHLAEQILANPDIQNAVGKIARLEGEDRETALVKLQNAVQLSVAQTLAETTNITRREIPHEPLAIAPQPAGVQLDQLAETIVNRAFETIANHTMLVNQTQDLLETPIVGSPLTRQPAIQTAVIPMLIRLIADRTETITGISPAIPSEAIVSLSSHLSDLLAAPNENTTRVVAQVVVDVLPAEVTVEQRDAIIDQSIAAVSALTIGQIVQNNPSPAVISAIADQSLNTVTEAARQFQPSTAVTPQTIEILVQAYDPTIPLTINQTVDQLVASFAPVTIDHQAAETAVRSFIQLTRTSEGEIIPNLSDTELRQIAVLAISSTGISASPGLIDQVTAILAPPSNSLTQRSLDLPTAAVAVQIIRFSPQLSGLLRTFSSPTSLVDHTGQPITIQPGIVNQIRQALLERAVGQYSAAQLTALTQEINLLFGRQLGQATAVLLADYLAQPTDRPILTATYYFVEGINQVRASLNNPANLSANSIIHHFGYIPGVTTTRNSLLQDILIYVSRHGTDSRTAQLLQQGITLLQTATLLFNGINEDDLRLTRQHFVESGAQANRERINEIDRIIGEINNIRENNPNLNRALNRFRKIRELRLRTGTASPIQIPFSRSRFGTPIHERNLFDPKIWHVRRERWLRKVFGEGDIIVRGRITRVNRLRYYSFRLNRAFYSQVSRFRVGRTYLRLSRRFSQGGLEKLLKSKIGTASEAGLKKLAGTAAGKVAGRAFVKVAASTAGKAVASLLVKLGITTIAGAATGGIGFVVTAVFEVGKKIIGGLFKGIKKGSMVFAKYTQSFVVGIAESDPYFDTNTLKSLKFVFIGAGIFIIVFLPVILMGGVLGGAFLQVKNTFLPNTASVSVPLSCTATRHLSEEVICKLSNDITPCNNRYITSRTWSQVNNCFNQITLTGNKDSVRAGLKASLDADFPLGRLQCVGFVTGIEAGFGRIFPQRLTAKDYLTLPVPTGYTLTKTGRPSVSPGDIVIWDWLVAGHMAVVISDNGGTITVSEANGFNGEIRLVAYPFTKLGDKSGNPDGILTR